MARGLSCCDSAKTAFSCSAGSLEVRRIESSAPTARSVPTCDSQNTACSRTSWSGSFRAVSSRMSSVPSASSCAIRKTAFRRRQTEPGVAPGEHPLEDRPRARVVHLHAAR